MEDNTLYKVVSAVFMGLMVLYLWPRVKRSMENSPKGESKDWQTFALLMLGLVVFVIVLVKMV